MYVNTKTPEERSAIAARAHATRKARRMAAEAIRQEAIARATGLHDQITALENKLAALRHIEIMNIASAALTGKVLLRASEIARAALPWARSCGVYFLLDGDEVVYVGQSTHVYNRIPNHMDKVFNRYAFVPCGEPMLDKLESLYIHCLRPRLNGDTKARDGKHAPIALDVLLGGGHLGEKK
jgi:hypothetical protein